MITDRDRRFFEALRFDVVGQENPLSCLPCLLPLPNGGYFWNLPDLPRGQNFDIGFEMGLAFLRLRLCPEGYTHPEQIDPAPLELADIEEAMRPGQASENAPAVQRHGFIVCIGTFFEHALNAPHTLPELRRRIFSLDNATLRRRCLAILDGENPPDIFAPEGLGWPA